MCGKQSDSALDSGPHTCCAHLCPAKVSPFPTPSHLQLHRLGLGEGKGQGYTKSGSFPWEHLESSSSLKWVKRQHHKYFHSNQEFPRGAGSKPSDSILLKALVTFRILNSIELPKCSSGSFTPKEWKFLRSPSAWIGHPPCNRNFQLCRTSHLRSISTDCIT